MLMTKNFNRNFIKCVDFEDAYQASICGGYLSHQIAGPFPEASKFLQGKIKYEKYNDLGIEIDYVTTLPNPMPGEHFE